MKNSRLHRLFNADSNRCFSVALDHGLSGERTMSAGFENIERIIQMTAHSGPDALQLSAGQAAILQNIPGKSKPALVLRLDVTNSAAPAHSIPPYVCALNDGIEQALRLDAAAVVVSLIRMVDRPELTEQCIGNILKLKPQCDRYSLPLIVDIASYRPHERGAASTPEGDVEVLAPLARQATELGADIVQVETTSDIPSFRKVIESARVPVLVRGGGRLGDRELLERTEQLISQGVGGIAYSRNIVQHPDAAGVTRALLAIVHERSKALDAARFIRG